MDRGAAINIIREDLAMHCNVITLQTHRGPDKMHAYNGYTF